MKKRLSKYLMFGCLVLICLLAACDSGTASPTPASTPTATAVQLVPTATTVQSPPTLQAATATVAQAALTQTPAGATSVPITGTAVATAVADNPVLIAQAHKVITDLSTGDFASVEALFNQSVSSQLSVDQLAAVWQQLTTQFGALKSQNSVQTAAQDMYTIVVVECTFEKGELLVRVVFDSEGKIAGLNIAPPPDSTPVPTAVVNYTAPDYVETTAFTERDISFGDPNWVLTGTLSMPAGAGPYPVVVLVQGSGPQDRDESIENLRPFRDIAWGLASKGIAVFRYDKRTFTYQQRMAATAADTVTIGDEVVDDAKAALAMLKTQSGVDPARIYLLGHSLGGMMAPLIAQESPDEAGVIIMAGPTRPFEDVVLDQYTYLAKLDGTVTAAEQTQLDQLTSQIKTVKTLTASSTVTPDQLPLGLPASYWLSLQNYSPATVAATLTEPLFILQGERDYQVTMPDYNGWRDALAGHNNATLKTYPGLSHPFVLGEGTPGPTDYSGTGHVTDVVISDLVDWVSNH